MDPEAINRTKTKGTSGLAGLSVVVTGCWKPSIIMRLAQGPISCSAPAGSDLPRRGAESECRSPICNDLQPQSRRHHRREKNLPRDERERCLPAIFALQLWSVGDAVEAKLAGGNCPGGSGASCLDRGSSGPFRQVRGLENGVSGPGY